jgi:hypothetical protein
LLDDLILQYRDARRRCRPSAFDMYTLREARARYAPRCTRLCRSINRPSSPASYSFHVTPSTPGAAFQMSSKEAIRLCLAPILGRRRKRERQDGDKNFRDPCQYEHSRRGSSPLSEHIILVDNSRP